MSFEYDFILKFSGIYYIKYYIYLCLYMYMSVYLSIYTIQMNVRRLF